MRAATLLNQLNQDYLKLHRVKEDLFWSTYMGVDADHEALAAAEQQLNHFISSPENAQRVRQELAALQSATFSDLSGEVEHGLKGWLALFEANLIESESGQQMMADLVAQEAQLFAGNQANELYFTNAHGEREVASLPTLAAQIRASDNEAVRQSCHQALLDQERWVVENGFIELVQARNRFARAQGYRNFFDYKVNKTEQMTPEQLFSILDSFEALTRERNLQSITELKQQKGASAITGYNFNYSWSGDITRELDPYVPFSKSLRRWVESFGRLNIDFSKADLTLDLLDREGKFPNGFCHGPIPSFYDQREGQNNWIPAKVNFTSNAKPDQIGSGFAGINTLFHEGGHAAHFANVKQNSPCFSQEFAPTSMAYAETQSMFCDSLLGDADWLIRYARNRQGQVIPESLIRAMIENEQPFKAYQERSILVVPYYEWALYSMDDDQMTPDALIALAREKEQQILALEVSPRPLLAIPHLLSMEAACSYQGYLLAHMAVYQTRAYFQQKYGYLTDNPKIGPELAAHYWKPGNSIDHNATLISLTGEGFNPAYLAEHCARSAAQAWDSAKQQMEAAKHRPQPQAETLNAQIRIVDGARVLASNDESDDKMCLQFEQYIEAHYGRPKSMM